MKFLCKKSIALLVLIFCSYMTLKAVTAPTYSVRVTAIRFLYGNGVGPTHSGSQNRPEYYRAYGSGGTVVEVTAQMHVGSLWTHLYGDTTLTLTATNGISSHSFDVIVLSGDTVGMAAIPYSAPIFDETTIAVGTTAKWSYSVTAVNGTYAASLDSSVSESVYWDREDAPATATFPPAATSEVGQTLTARSALLTWTPLTATTSGGYYNSDFYEYRIYYRLYSDDASEPWQVWNSAYDPTLTGITYNPDTPPADDANSHFTGGKKYTTITNLTFFARYEFYVAAVDLFGNESAAPVSYFSMMTQPYSIEATISDSKNKYDDFVNLADATVRTVGDVAVKVDLKIVSTDAVPDLVRIWYTACDDSIDIVNSDNSVNESAFNDGELASVDALPSGTNLWSGYLNSDSLAISPGNTVRFVVETQTGGVATFSDLDFYDLDANDDEWTFYVDDALNFNGNQALILNNVLTKKNPTAYPSYYLTEDAYVTITVHDVRGRQVAIILDNAFRRFGQNIKEGGWSGVNRARRPLGPGLYYIKIVARNSSGKTVLDEVRKVVVAK